MLTPEGLETNFRDVELAQIDMSRGKKMETHPGDVLIFHSLAPHQSGRNLAEVSRRSLYLSYNAARSGDLRGRYYEHYKNRENGDTKYFR
jgi:ectoine hydroxylase-related dioxygenase (phytanoyl-CoA dioxygenase family)